MRKTISAVIVASLALLVSDVFANDIPQITLDEKVNQSTLVAIGKVSVINPGACLIYFKCATVEISRLLKGKAEENIQVLFGGELVELRPNCCEVGKTYLFFLKKKDRHVFESINAPYGIFEIPGPQRGSSSIQTRVDH